MVEERDGILNGYLLVALGAQQKAQTVGLVILEAMQEELSVGSVLYLVLRHCSA